METNEIKDRKDYPIQYDFLSPITGKLFSCEASTIKEALMKRDAVLRELLKEARAEPLKKIKLMIDVSEAVTVLEKAIDAFDYNELCRDVQIIEVELPDQPLNIYLRCQMVESIKFGKYGPREPEWHFRELIIEEISFLYGTETIEFENAAEITEKLISMYYISEI